ncbi:Hypothetical Protein MfeM64YM_0438 [Mycoplasmopsis fermentans M64]|uniref:Uncharacterized protein n=1 Tax=Mycoplasmopsis fermentans (strain M64) TaxID=943945 RepID=A0AB32XBX3_MYCFM|nr:Hypothetical Protein MfeM64YM_0438 [Mycoplasmopsis fermentans M64]
MKREPINPVIDEITEKF